MTKIQKLSSVFTVAGLICLLVQMKAHTNYLGVICSLFWLTSLYLSLLDSRLKNLQRTKLADYCFIIAYLLGVVGLARAGFLIVAGHFNPGEYRQIIPSTLAMVSIATAINYLAFEWKKKRELKKLAEKDQESKINYNEIINIYLGAFWFISLMLFFAFSGPVTKLFFQVMTFLAVLKIISILRKKYLQKKNT